jgi:molybdenum cofactor cytidylyltransferase
MGETMDQTKPDCVVLAAGKSERMGRWKMTLPWQDSTIIETAVSGALTVCGRAVVVAGYRAEEVLNLFRENPAVTIAVNEDYESGMFSSVKRGCREVETERFFLALGDMPSVSPAVYRRLIFYTAADAVIPKFRGKRGHPILLGAGMAERILTYGNGETLHHVLSDVVTMSVPVGDMHIIHDIDTEADYKRALSNSNEKGGKQ